MVKLAHAYSFEIDNTLARIRKLYEMFYRPVMLVDEKGQIRNLEWVWTTPEAEKVCHILSQRLARLAEEQQKILNKDAEDEQHS